jgi:hypothetical protein
MDFQQATLLATSGVIVTYFVWYKLYHTLTISDIPGPKNPSWIYGIISTPSEKLMTLTHVLRNRTPMVVAAQRSRCSREGNYGRIRDYRSLERAAWGKFLLLASGALSSLLLGMLYYRKNACGLPTPRRSAIFSRVQAICTRSRTLTGNKSW